MGWIRMIHAFLDWECKLETHSDCLSRKLTEQSILCNRHQCIQWSSDTLFSGSRTPPQISIFSHIFESGLYFRSSEGSVTGVSHRCCSNSARSAHARLPNLFDFQRSSSCGTLRVSGWEVPRGVFSLAL